MSATIVSYNTSKLVKSVYHRNSEKLRWFDQESQKGLPSTSVALVSAPKTMPSYEKINNVKVNHSRILIDTLMSCKS